jgi:integrase/recombinase XerD
MSKRRAPPGTYWRGQTLWARAQVAGREYRGSLDTDDPRVAAKRRQKWHDELKARRHGEATIMVDEAVKAWALWLADAVRPKTAERYLTSLNMLGPWLQGRALEEVDAELLGEIVTGRREGGASLATVKRDLGALSSVFGFAIDKGWIDTNPVLARLERLKERRTPGPLPDPAHIELVARRASGRLQDMIRAAWLTGCRQDELASAPADAFDAARRQLTVVGKGGRRRTIGLSDAAAAVVAPPKGATWLFQDEAGHPFANMPSTWQRIVLGKEGFKAGPDNDGIRRFRFHDLRHRFAVDYLKAEHSIYELQMHLGHTSVKTTEMYLVHLTPAEQLRAKFGPGVGTKAGTENIVVFPGKDELVSKIKA